MRRCLMKLRAVAPVYGDKRAAAIACGLVRGGCDVSDDDDRRTIERLSRSRDDRRMMHGKEAVGALISLRGAPLALRG